MESGESWRRLPGNQTLLLTLTKLPTSFTPQKVYQSSWCLKLTTVAELIPHYHCSTVFQCQEKATADITVVPWSTPWWIILSICPTGITFAWQITGKHVVTEFESECCRILTIFCKCEIRRTFRLAWILIQLSFWKAQVHHSSQSAISHTQVNKYTLNSCLYRINTELERNF